MWTDDRIILLVDISAPLQMAGTAGQVKVIDRDVPLYYAKLAVKSGIAKQIESDDEIEKIRLEIQPKEQPPKPEPEATEEKETGYRIIIMEDISGPPAIAASKGDVKIVGTDITIYDARLLVKGGKANRVGNAKQIDGYLVMLGLKEPPRSRRKRKEKDVESTADKAGD